jgi:hypothetical protein
MTLTVTGITYLDGCMPLTGIAINSDGDEVNLIFNETPSGQQRVALLDTIEATGEMVTSPHHGGRAAFAIHSMKMLRRGTVGSVRRLRGKAKAKTIS